MFIFYYYTLRIFFKRIMFPSLLDAKFVAIHKYHYLLFDPKSDDHIFVTRYARFLCHFCILSQILFIGLSYNETPLMIIISFYLTVTIIVRFISSNYIQTF